MLAVKYRVYLEQDEDGVFVANCGDLSGSACSSVETRA